MRTIPFMKGALVAAMFAMSFSACKKEDKDSESDFTVQSGQLGENDNIGADVDAMSDEAYNTGSVSRNGGSDPYSTLSCATVTLDTISNPHVITIDFGTGCTGVYGNVRSGVVTITYSGSYFATGSVRTITFTNYYVNGRHVEGTRTVTNNGLNSSGNYTWTVQATNMKVTRQDGSYHQWNSTRTREMIAGYGTSTIGDDIYLITGSANGSNNNGNSCTANITTALRKEMACRYIVSGVIEVTPSTGVVRTLDFGTGTCDNQATVTKNGVSRIIYL